MGSIRKAPHVTLGAVPDEEEVRTFHSSARGGSHSPHSAPVLGDRRAITRDRAALEPKLPSLLPAFREATGGGASGMVDEYRRYYGSWGFDLGYIRQSVTVWQGEQDKLVPMSHARRLASTLPNSTLRVVPSTGHLLPLAIADEIVEDLAP